MENEPINYLKLSKKNQKINSKPLKSNDDYKKQLELLALDWYSVNEKLKNLISEVSSIIESSGNFIITNEGDIIGFEFTDNKNKTYNNLFNYYHSRTFDYDKISKYIHKFNETLEKTFNQGISPLYYNNVINNMSIEIESIRNGKSRLDYLFKELGDKINETYIMNFKNKKKIILKIIVTNFILKINSIPWMKLMKLFI
nr:hypothetical protein [uncultured Moellerella sp.]